MIRQSLKQIFYVFSVMITMIVQENGCQYIYKFCQDKFSYTIDERIWNIFFHVEMMAFNNSYQVAKLY